jgi:hypothetical protein
LQEVGKCSESGSIEEISSPSLQDRFWQESGGNILVLRDKEGLTRPSLQDRDDPGAFGPGAFAGADCVLRTEGSSPGISDSNRGFVPSSIGGFPAGSCGSPGRSSSSRSASAVSETAGTLPAAIAVVLYAGIGNKKPSAVGIGAPDLLAHGFCLQGKTMTLFRGPILGKNKNQIRRRWVINLQGERKNIQDGIS